VDALLGYLGFETSETRAAAIQGIFTLVGVIVPGLVAAVSLVRREPRRLQREKARDYLIALEAELNAELSYLVSIDTEEHWEKVVAHYRADPAYTVFVPTVTGMPVLDLVRENIEILPEEVIASLVQVYRMRSVLMTFSSDLRSAGFRAISQERQLNAFRDYISMLMSFRRSVEEALQAVHISLGTRPG